MIFVMTALTFDWVPNHNPLAGSESTPFPVPGHFVL